MRIICAALLLVASGAHAQNARWVSDSVRSQAALKAAFDLHYANPSSKDRLKLFFSDPNGRFSSFADPASVKASSRRDFKTINAILIHTAPEAKTGEQFESFVMAINCSTGIGSVVSGIELDASGNVIDSYDNSRAPDWKQSYPALLTQACGDSHPIASTHPNHTDGPHRWASGDGTTLWDRRADAALAERRGGNAAPAKTTSDFMGLYREVMDGYPSLNGAGASGAQQGGWERGTRTGEGRTGDPDVTACNYRTDGGYQFTTHVRRTLGSPCPYTVNFNVQTQQVQRSGL